MQSKNRPVALNDIQSNLIDLDVAFYTYIIQSFNSAHENAAFRTALSPVLNVAFYMRRIEY